MEPPRKDDPEGDDFSDSDQVWFERLTGRSKGPALHPAQAQADSLREVLDPKAQAEWDARMGEAETDRQWQLLQQQIAAARTGRAASNLGLEPGERPQSAADAAPADQASPQAQVPRRSERQGGLPTRPAPNKAGARPTRPAGSSDLWSRLRTALFGRGGTASAPARWGTVAAFASIAALAFLVVPMMHTERDLEGPPLQPGMKLYGEAGDTRIQQRATPTPRREAEAFASALRAAGLKPGLYRDPDHPQVLWLDLDLAAEQLEAAGVVFEGRRLRRPGVGFARVEFVRP